jgi:hypothetical protein
MRTAIVLIAAVAICAAQQIRLRVVDTLGNAIPSARIDVLSPAGIVIQSGSQDAVPDAPRGSMIRVSAPGFGEALVAPAPTSSSPSTRFAFPRKSPFPRRLASPRI